MLEGEAEEGIEEGIEEGVEEGVEEGIEEGVEERVERRDMSMQWSQRILQPSQWQLVRVSMSTSHETMHCEHHEQHK